MKVHTQLQMDSSCLLYCLKLTIDWCSGTLMFKQGQAVDVTPSQ